MSHSVSSSYRTPGVRRGGGAERNRRRLHTVVMRWVHTNLHTTSLSSSSGYGLYPTANNARNSV